MTSLLRADCFDANFNGFSKDSVIFTTLMDMNIIDACSFLDEYHEYFGVTTEKTYLPKIIEIKQICKPFIKQINKWKDLKKYRNTFSAHNLRNKKHENIYRSRIDHIAPRKIHEMELLCGCIQLITYIIKSEFEVEFVTAKQNINLDIPSYYSMTKDECYKIIDSLIQQANLNLNSSGRDYTIKEIKTTVANTRS